jgi:hypothetical protein
MEQILNTLASKLVLILGRFTDERKVVLEALRHELKKHNFVPILFDFERSGSRDFIDKDNSDR